MKLRAAMLIVSAAVCACGGDVSIETPPPPRDVVLLKDVVIPNVPSPYYHFEYDAAGRVRSASFASGFRTYDVKYDDGGRISTMQVVAFGNDDRLEYVYDAGRVSAVKYVHANGDVFSRLFLAYEGDRLAEVKRERLANGVGYVVDKVLSFGYYPNGELREVVEHRPAVEGLQDETTTTDRYEEYGGEMNVDAFGLLHTEFFDHLVLLPGVQLQRGNPARLTHTGDGVHYTVTWTYLYDERNRPREKNGVLTFTNGPDSARTFPVSSVFTYY